jgi:hypothetical protein
MIISVCLNGFIDDLEMNHETCLRFVQNLIKQYNCQVDIFLHAWDFTKKDFEKISESQKENILKNINPKKYRFEDITTFNNIRDNVIRDGSKYSPIIGETYSNWELEDLYGLMVSTHLKKTYEIDNGFTYDVCIRMKIDTNLDEDEINKFSKNNILNIKYNTIYSFDVKNLKIKNSFWFCDSITFDKLSESYRWIPTLGKRAFNFRDNVDTDEFLFFFIKMFRMNISVITN